MIDGPSGYPHNPHLYMIGYMSLSDVNIIIQPKKWLNHGQAVDFDLVDRLDMHSRLAVDGERTG